MENTRQLPEFFKTQQPVKQVGEKPVKTYSLFPKLTIGLPKVDPATFKFKSDEDDQHSDGTSLPPGKRKP